MKSKRNLTRFTYESSTYQGWRLSLIKSGSTFTHYFSDKEYKGAKKSLAAAEKALVELKALLDTAKRVNGRFPGTTIRKAEKLLTDAH